MDGVSKVFVSATTADLGSCRGAVKEALLTIGIHPIEQTNFPPDHRTIREMLRDKIAGCDAILHIAGFTYGAEPSERSPGEPRRSYTQLEFDIALELGKPIYVFLAEDGFPFDEHEEEGEVERALQLAHRETLRSRHEAWSSVATREELEKRVRELQTEIERLHAQMRRNRRTLALFAASALIVLGTVGFGLHQLSKRGAAVEENVEEMRAMAGELFDELSGRVRVGSAPGEEELEEIYEMMAGRRGMEVEVYKHALDDWDRRIANDPAALTEDRFRRAYRNGEYEEAAGIASAATAATLAQLAEGRGSAADLRLRAGREFAMLGDAYWAMPDEPGIAAKAEQAYRRALEFIKREEHPDEWASLTVDHSVCDVRAIAVEAQRSISAGDDGEAFVARAAAKFAEREQDVELAVATLDPSADAREWGAANFALTLLRYFNAGIPPLEPAERQERWQAVLEPAREAADAFAYDRFYLGWACSRFFTGFAHDELAWSEPDKTKRRQHFEAARIAFEDALPDMNWEDWDDYYGDVLRRLGLIYYELGFGLHEQEAGRHFNISAGYFLDALDEFDKHDNPRKWGDLQYRFSMATKELAILAPPGDGRGSRAAADSVAAARASLTTLSKESAPFYWAQRQNQLGLALEIRARDEPPETAEATLGEALREFARAREVLTAEDYPDDHKIVTSNIARIEGELERVRAARRDASPAADPPDPGEGAP